MKNFFKISDATSDNIKYSLKTPSILLAQNVYVQWLQSLWLKANKHFPVYINKELGTHKLPFGMINTQGPNCEEDKTINHDLNKYTPQDKTSLQFKLFVPDNENMQNYIHWQRYRKFWWSSVS